MRVTVFGGSSPKPGEPAYQDALSLGRLLGKAGHTALTGGYIGTMEAVLRGTAEAGGHAIGVTCEEIEAWRKVKPNPWVQEEMRYASMRERLFALIENCDAAMALPGGVGTLAEIAVMWNHMQTESIPTRPLILIGEGWRQTIQLFLLSLDEYTSAEHRKLLSYAPDVETAFSQLESPNNS
ncbi:MAG: LOG family protein [Chloroflexi bacterium]|nr:LOG family protein [Chloroflexota bacterium]